MLVRTALTKLCEYPVRSVEKLRYADTDRNGHISNSVFAVCSQNPCMDQRHATADRATPSPEGWRSRKDPFESTWPEVRRWAEAEPELTGSQLMQRLQARYPGAYPDGQLRTLQRRLKRWRGEMARALVLGASSNTGTAHAPACPDIHEDPIVLAALKDEPFGWPQRGHP